MKRARSRAQRDERMGTRTASLCSVKNEKTRPSLRGTPEEEKKNEEEEIIQR